MKVAIVADAGIPDGGAPKVAVESARALAEAGQPVVYIHAIGTQGDERLVHPLIERIGLGLDDVWTLPIHKAAIAGVWNREAARRLRRVLDERVGAGGIVHVHQWTKAFSPSVFAAVGAAQARLVITLHDYFIACPTGLFYLPKTGEACPHRPLSLACLTESCDPRSPAHKLVRVARAVAQAGALLGAGLDVVHVSDLGQRVVEPYLPGGARSHRIDNPVPLDQQPPAAIGEASRAVYVGRLTREKGADLVAAAARRAGLRTLFIGSGPAETDIRAADPDAEVRPWATPAQVNAWLRAEARVLVAPSRWPETGPLTVYEALAAGLPVVGSVRSGAAGRLADGLTGFIVSPEVAPLAEALAKFNDVSVARSMGVAAYRAYWTDPLSPQRHARATLALYADIARRAN